MPWADRTRVDHVGVPYYDVEARVLVPRLPMMGGMQRRIRHALFPAEVEFRGWCCDAIVVDYFRVPLRWMTRDQAGRVVPMEP